MGKKLFSTILALTCALLCVFSLAACGNDDNPQTVAVTGVTLNKTELTLEVGGEETLSVTVTPDEATDKNVAWSSDKPEIASVDNDGKVTAKAAGTAVVTAKAGEESTTCTVTVNAAKPVKMTEEQWKTAIDNTINAKNYTRTHKFNDYDDTTEISFDFEHKAVRIKNPVRLRDIEHKDNIICEQNGGVVLYYRDSETAAWNKKAFDSHVSTFSDVFRYVLNGAEVFFWFVRDLYDSVVYDDTNDVYTVTLETDTEKDGYIMSAGTKFVLTFHDGYASTMILYDEGLEGTLFYSNFGTTTIPLP